MNTEKPRRQASSATRATLALAAAAIFALLLSGCSRLEGWGMIVWSVKGTTAKAGTVVPVYLKSDISKSYVIGMPGDARTKSEVPFPSLEFFSSKAKAEKRAAEFAPYASLYLTAGRDGLPIRDTPKVSGRRVYRLRLGEAVKALNKADGDPVFTGGRALPGEWYYVQATDGTRGYVFSNTMILYEEKEGGSAPVIATAPAPSASLLDMIYAKPWRPAYYQLMLDDDSVDPDLFALQYGLFADAKNSQIRIELPGYSNAFNFSSVSQAGDWLVFEGSALQIRFENDATIVASWGGTDQALPDEGWAKGGQAARFVHIDTSVPVVASGENARRDTELKLFFQRLEQIQPNAGSSLTFLSDAAGILTIDSSGSFEWSHTDQLPASFAPRPSADAQDSVVSGKIRFGLHLGPGLAPAWSGGFSLLTGSSDKPDRQDYLYRFENGQLIIAKASPVTMRGTNESVDARFTPETYYLVVK